jgi:hypothetical protein
MHRRVMLRPSQARETLARIAMAVASRSRAVVSGAIESPLTCAQAAPLGWASERNSLLKVSFSRSARDLVAGLRDRLWTTATLSA